MTTCPNCGAVLNCSCQLKTASNGTRVCNACVATYEESLRNSASSSTTVVPVDNAPISEVKTYMVAPTINSVTAQYNNYNN